MLCDANQVVYTAVWFLPAEHHGDITINCVKSKSRVVSERKIAIVELLVSTVGAGLVHSILRSSTLL